MALLLPKALFLQPILIIKCIVFASVRRVCDISLGIRGLSHILQTEIGIGVPPAAVIVTCLRASDVM